MELLATYIKFLKRMNLKFLMTLINSKFRIMIKIFYN
jgi:hypothetical protein